MQDDTNVPPITNFHGDHFFLSNFYPTDIVYDSEVYPTLEHAFQAAKTLDKHERLILREAGSPAMAKRLGRRVVSFVIVPTIP